MSQSVNYTCDICGITETIPRLHESGWGGFWGWNGKDGTDADRDICPPCLLKVIQFCNTLMDKEA